MNVDGLFLGLAQKTKRKPAPVAGRDNNAAGISIPLAGREPHEDLLPWLAKTTKRRLVWLATLVAGRDNHTDQRLVVGRDNHAARGPSPVVGRDKIARV